MTSALPHVGDLFGRYRIDAEIGRGGMGVVYRATDTSIDRPVALKVVAAALGGSAEFLARFEREAAVLARLDSPHVIAIYDYGTHEGVPYLATQFVAGGDLGALLLARGPMPPRLALTLAAQVADALHDAHRVGVVHRDVKATNVLLRDAGPGSPSDLHAYLCDFGIARTAGPAGDGLTTAGSVSGTWTYLAPECGRGAPGSPASDVYALGCLLWATLTGGPPFRGTDVEVAVAHQQAPVPQLAGDDPFVQHVNGVLRRCLAKDPADRYTDADDARSDLLAGLTLPLPERITSTVPPSQRPTMAPSPVAPMPTPATAPRRRRHAVVALVLAAVLAVGGGAVAAITLGGGSPAPLPPPRTATPTSPPAPTSPTSPTTAPEDERRDEGGPITGDLDGDGVGEVAVEFYHSVPQDRGAFDTFSDRTVFTPVGDRFEQGPTERLSYEIENQDPNSFTGDFDGDDVLEQLAVKIFDKADRRIRLVGTLSGGDQINDDVAIDAITPFVHVADLDGDGADDLLLQYYEDYEVSPTRFASVVRGDDGTFGDAEVVATVPRSSADATFGAGDLDGDGRAELLVLEDLGNTKDFDRRYGLTVWRGAQELKPGPTISFITAIGPALLAGDLDGDEDDEVVIGDGGNLGTLQVIDLRGERLTKPRAWGALPPEGTLAGVWGLVDVDGDGLDDAVCLSEVSDREVRLLVGLSDGDRFVGRGVWAVWQRKFKTSKYFDSLSIPGQDFS